MAFPIFQRAAVDPDESTAEAIADWHYRVARATASELRTATKSLRCFPYASDQACTGFARRRKERAEAQLRLAAKHTLKARLKRYPQPKLNLSCVERIERAGDFAEGAVCHIRIYSTQIAVIKDVQKIKAELQVALFPEPRQVVVL